MWLERGGAWQPVGEGNLVGEGSGSDLHVFQALQFLLLLSYWEKVEDSKSSALGRTGEHYSLRDVHWPYLMFSATSDEPNIEIQTALAMKMQFEDKPTSPSSCTENAGFLLTFTDTN